MPGIAIAFAYGFDISLGALAFLIFGTTLIWIIREKTNLPFEAVTATVFASSLAVAFLFLPQKHASRALLGDISKIDPLAVLIISTTSLAIFLIMRYIYSNMVLISISPDLAQTRGINIKFHNFIYLTAIAVTVAFGVRIVGGLMTAALVAIPACTSKNICTNLIEYSHMSMLVGAIACGAGILFSLITGLPVGPLIIICSAILFCVSFFVKK
jgi:ABC-type Mn2+/Zn2+ transport system permease subunit